MKIKKWTVEIKEVKVRQPFAPLTKKFKNLKAYNRKRMKLAFAEQFRYTNSMKNIRKPFTAGQVMDQVIESLTDHDVGWVNVHGSSPGSSQAVVSVQSVHEEISNKKFRIIVVEEA